MGKFRLMYVDSSGQATERVVTPLPPPWVWDGAFDAHCERAGETRSFKWARVRQATDLETGELLTGTALMTRLAPHIDAEKAIALRLAPLARCLVAFARQDLRRFDDKRKRVVAKELLAHLGPESTVTVDWLVRYLSEGIPEAHRLMENPAELAEELNAKELAVARIAARLMAAGSGRVQVSAELASRLREVFGE